MVKPKSSRMLLVICLGKNLLEEAVERVLCDMSLNNGINALHSGV